MILIFKKKKKFNSNTLVQICLLRSEEPKRRSAADESIVDGCPKVTVFSEMKASILVRSWSGFVEHYTVTLHTMVRWNALCRKPLGQLRVDVGQLESKFFLFMHAWHQTEKIVSVSHICLQQHWGGAISCWKMRGGASNRCCLRWFLEFFFVFSFWKVVVS